MSDLGDLVSGRLLIRALDDLHEIAQATSEVPAMVEPLQVAAGQLSRLLERLPRLP